MSGLRPVLLGARFLLELALLASLAYWGFNLGAEPVVTWVAGIGAPLVVAVVWGRWIAPKATRQLDDPLRFTIESVLFLAGCGALIASGQAADGIWLLVLFLVDRAALSATGGTGL